MKGYPKHFKTVLLSTFAALVASGLTLAPGLLMFRLDLDVPDWASPFERTSVAAIHVGAALLTCFFVGSLWSIHMRTGWKRRKNHRSGTLLCTAFLVLAASGLGGLYFGDELLARGNAIVHLSAGIILPSILIFHSLAWRRRRNQ
ncbi:MAG: hypothetical protein KDN19_01565 [Verrucomicrobiae bacterium]|nr:hypothetical protein [Verrucomicrobiae bacterium]